VERDPAVFLDGHGDTSRTGRQAFVDDLYGCHGSSIRSMRTGPGDNGARPRNYRVTLGNRTRARRVTMSRRVDFVSDFLDAVEDPPRRSHTKGAASKVDELALDITRALLAHSPEDGITEQELALLTHAPVSEVHQAVDLLERSEIAETTTEGRYVVVQMRKPERPGPDDPIATTR
jgi:hypothetical protein